MSFQIISSTEVTEMDRIRLQPFVRYVLPAGWAKTMSEGLKEAGQAFAMSGWNSYHRPYAGQSLNGKRLAVYRHAAFGDQLMVMAVVAYLMHRWPAAKIDVYCVPGVMDLWQGMPVRALPAPLTLDAAKSYDYHLFYDQMAETDGEHDQGNAYDNLFGFAGCGEAEDTWKRPRVQPQPGDTAELEAQNFKVWLPEKYLLLHLQASNPNRTYPPEQSAEVVNRFLAEFPDWSVVVVGLDKEGVSRRFEEAREPGKSTDDPGQVINLVGRLKKFRSLIPLVQWADLVVCPDSSVGHLAAAFPEVPVISLWGLFHPADRAKYYRNHHPLFAPEVCPFAPCRSHAFKLPQEKCRQAANATEGEQPSCNALRAIAPERIVAKAREIFGAE